MQHFLTSRQMVEIPIKHLFAEYRFWIGREKPFDSVAKELATLAKQREDFRRIIEPQKTDVIFGLATFMECFDIRTAYPLLLFLLDAGLNEGEWNGISTLLESYLMRRALLGWSTKAYNRVFLNILKSLRNTRPTFQTLKAALSGLSGESSAWPTDADFFTAWQSRPAYLELNNAKLVHILLRLSNAYLTTKNESITIGSPLTVEHILPQKWIESWPLTSGEQGLTLQECYNAKSDDPRADATARRNAALQTIGNLTILTQELNSSVSNSAWLNKKPELLKASLLPINQQLHEFDVWNEEAILKRSKELFHRAVRIWPAPDERGDGQTAAQHAV